MSADSPTTLLVAPEPSAMIAPRRLNFRLSRSIALLCMNVTGETRGRKLCIRPANASTRFLIVPRYLFRFSSGKEFVADNVGTELPNLSWRIVVTDATKQPVLTVLFPASSATRAEGLWATIERE